MELADAIGPDGMLDIRVTPRASRARVEVGADGVRVYVTVPPEDGKANRAVIQLVARTLKIAPSRVELVSGATSRAKRLRIR